MLPYEIIARKRDQHALSTEQIQEFIDGVVSGKWADYQISALLMAVFLQGMTENEIFALTESMMHSGQTLDFSSSSHFTVDKHSTGGVGDKVSLILAPLAAACGVHVPMLSGRGLGHTGGTLDKLSAIPGFNVFLPMQQFAHIVENVGCCINGQTGELAPADKKLYALRDVTGTVESIPLIASSIMSKKLAAGPQGLVMDVKTGTGAFMENYANAKALALLMNKIGQHFGRKMVALITNMDQVLGETAGNALEVIESIETLKNQGPEDLTELTLQLTAWMIYFAEKADSPQIGYQIAQQKLRDGSALQKLAQMIEAQQGNPDVIEKYDLFPKAPYQIPVLAPTEGFVHSIQVKEMGWAAVELGAGRRTQEDILNLATGISVYKKIGDQVERNEPIALLHAANETEALAAQKRILAAFQISDQKTHKLPIIYEIID